MTYSRAIALILAAPILLTPCISACSDSNDNAGAATPSVPDDGGSAVPSRPVAATSYSADFAKAYCESIAGCCEQEGFPTDTASCTSLVEMSTNLVLDQVMAGDRADYNAEAAELCIAQHRASLTACYGEDKLMQIIDVCSGMFTGKVPIGGECTATEQCGTAQEDVFCVAGICTTDSGLWSSHIAELGEGCSYSCWQQFAWDKMGTICSEVPTDASGGDCWLSDNLYCSLTSGVCEQVARAGQPCAENTACVDGSICDAGTCISASLGASCSTNQNCAETDYCNHMTESWTCSPRRENGDICESSTDCLSENCDCLDANCDQYVCQVWTFASAGNCMVSETDTPGGG